ncbi:MAG: twin-arginine translocase subunit TatC [Calditrichia bacterium]|nr:twin-arginine translocase subunit TatC [Calditrichia bacterium]
MKRKQINEREMPFLDHLEELRWRLFKSLITVFVLMLICWGFSDQLLEVLRYPGTQITPPLKMQVLKVQTVFMTKLEIALVAGVILGLPVIIYQLWQFMAPGLIKKEKKFLPIIILATIICFAIGGLFAYFIIIPFALQFFMDLAPADIENNIALDFYIGFLLRIIVVFGVVFELPIISIILTKMGLLTPKFMRKYRRYALVIAFILGAILTPPDPSTQIMLAIPIILLYEISIFLSYLFSSKKEDET